MFYTIRYRSSDWRGRPALIVEDPRGAACLVCGGQVQACLVPRGADDPFARLADLLGGGALWTRTAPELAGALLPAPRCDVAAQELGVGVGW